MNVISNNCAGSYIMTSGTEPLGNPFAWAFTPYKSIKVLLEHFYDINFAHISLNESDRWKGTYTLTIDGMVDIYIISTITSIHFERCLTRKTMTFQCVIYGNILSINICYESNV